MVSKLTLAESIKPDEANVGITIDDDGRIGEYYYYWPTGDVDSGETVNDNDNVNVVEDFPNRRTKWRLKKANEYLKQATEENRDMVLELSKTGTYASIYQANDDILLEKKGFVRSKESNAENYSIFIEGYADEFYINPSEDIPDSYNLIPANEAQNMVNENITSKLMQQPTKGGGLGGLFDDVGIKTLLLVGFVVMIAVVYANNAGMI